MTIARTNGRLLTRREAADYLGLSARTFQRHVVKRVARVQVGNRAYYTQEDLDLWVEQQKVGESYPGDDRASRSTSGSGTRASATTSPRAREILATLQSEQRPSTPRLFPVDGGPARR
jgi:Helix-turn-helix domain